MAVVGPIAIVRMVVRIVVVLPVSVVKGLRLSREDQMAVGAPGRVSVDMPSVPVQDADARAAHDH